MTESHRLSTILFADIAGYTALMQKDEKAALDALSLFQDTLEHAIKEHEGEIVQYYGDGALIAFDSTTHGVAYAEEVQDIFKNKLNIPVRIGIHLGEVVFKNDNAFGDGVNIASRIESIGISGCVLLSRAVRDQIKNKTEFELKGLGKFNFKNVDEPVEIYGLLNHGFAVPNRREIKGKLKDRKDVSGSNLSSAILILVLIGFLVTIWYFIDHRDTSRLSENIQDHTVAVLPFENQTGNENLESFGLMNMDYISQGLIETGEAKVIKEDANVILAAMTDNPAYIPNRAEVLIKGRYYSSGPEQITVIAEILEAKSRHIIFSPSPCKGNVNDPMSLIETVQQQILGYWASSNKIITKSPPRYDAYLEFVKAEKLPFKEWPQKIVHLKRAVALDSSFSKPLFSLLYIGKQFVGPELTDSILVKLENMKQDFSEYDRMSYATQLARIRGNYSKSAELAWQLYNKYKQIADAKFTINFYHNDNYSTKCEELFKIINERENLTYATPNEQYILASYLSALYNTRQFEKVIQVIDNTNTMSHETVDCRIPIYNLKAHTQLGRMEEVDSLLTYYEHKNFTMGGYYTPGVLTWTVCNEIYMLDWTDILGKYLDEFERWTKVYTKTHWDNTFNFFLAFLRGNYEEAYPLALKAYEEDSKKWFFTESPAITLIELGRTEEALQWKQKLIDTGNDYPGILEYAIANIEGNLGNIEQAISHYKKANYQGLYYNWFLFRNDIFTKPFKGDERFLDATRTK